MLICLPGISSRVKRAATSATRPAPLVMTTNWMITRIRKMTQPTRRSPPTTKWPKASITLPADACSRTRRVDEMLSARRKSVVSSSREGRTEKSSGRRTYIASSRIVSDTVRFSDSSISSSAGGRGISIIPMRPITPTAVRMSPYPVRVPVMPLQAARFVPPRASVGQRRPLAAHSAEIYSFVSCALK